jgi:hypothetical protein
VSISSQFILFDIQMYGNYNVCLNQKITGSILIIHIDYFSFSRLGIVYFLKLDVR